MRNRKKPVLGVIGFLILASALAILVVGQGSREQRLEPTIQELERALEEARERGDKEEEKEILEVLADVAQELGKDDDLWEILERLLELARERNDDQEQREILEFALDLAEQRGDEPSRKEVLELLLRLAEKRGDEGEAKEIRDLLEKPDNRARQWDDNEPSVDLKPAGNDIFVSGGNLSLRFGQNGQVKEIVAEDRTIIRGEGATVYRLGGQRAAVSGVEETETGLRIDVATDDRSAQVSVDGGDDIRVRFRGASGEHVTFGFGLPFSTRFHQVETANLARVLDRRTLKRGPVQTPGRAAFWEDWTSQILVAELDGGLLSISGRSDYTKRFLEYRAYLSRCRLRESDLAFESTCRPGFPLVLSWHESLEGAAAKYRLWIEQSLDIRPIRERPGLEWLEDLKLVITLDMQKSNGDVAHSYQDAIGLAKELYRAGANGRILFYLPGWAGKYDMAYPQYAPAEELGGKEKFKEMVDVLHSCGYRVMLHYTHWGADPFSPELEQIQHLAAERDEGGRPLVGWPGPLPAEASDYESGRQQLKAKRTGTTATFSTVFLPKEPPYLEAHLTLGGIKSYGGEVRVSMNARSLEVPGGHYRTHDSYTFPYTFLVYAGENEVYLEFLDGDVPDLSEAWYRLRGAVYSPLGLHSYPIVAMNTADDRWVELFANRVVENVRSYSIDAVHLDASAIWNIDEPEHKLDRRLARALPGVAFSTEMPTEPSMATCQLSQNGSMPEQPDQYSPLAHLISKPYRRCYLHLIHPRGFVPVHLIGCRREPWPATEEDLKDLRQVFRCAPRFGLTPTIRVNYRDYGLDAETRKATLSLYSADEGGER